MTKAITAHGSGYIDLRTAVGGTSGHIVLDTDGGTTDSTGTTGAGVDSGKLVSTTGTVSVMAGGALSTTAATDGAAEIDTTGSVLLEAKNTIGTDANRIELDNAAKLAARTLGGVATDSLYLRKLGTADALEVGTVNRVNATAVDNAITAVGTNSTSLAGLTTSNNGHITLTTQGASHLTLAADVNAGTGVLDLQAGQGGTGGITQTGGRLTGSAARIDAGGDAVLTQAGNRVNVLASSTNRLEYLDAGVLAIGAVAGESHVGALDSVWIRAQGLQDPANPEATALSIPFGFRVTGNGTGRNAVVLVADGAFWNYAGPTAIDAPNSRWLVYDYNQNLEYRLGGLPFDWRRVAATYESSPPALIGDIGNVYITTAAPVKPQQFVPANPLDPSPGVASPGFPADLGAPVPAPFSVGQDVVSSGMGTVQVSSAGLPIFPVEGAISIVAGPGKFFETNLVTYTAGEEVAEAFLASGAPLPAWIKVDLANQRVFGVMPKEGGQHRVKLRLKKKSGEPGRVIEIVLSGSVA